MPKRNPTQCDETGHALLALTPAIDRLQHFVHHAPKLLKKSDFIGLEVMQESADEAADVARAVLEILQQSGLMPETDIDRERAAYKQIRARACAGSPMRTEEAA